jgi:hypothetical protein
VEGRGSEERAEENEEIRGEEKQKEGAQLGQAEVVAKKVPRTVSPSEARNLSSLEVQEKERFLGEEHASE